MLLLSTVLLTTTMTFHPTDELMQSARQKFDSLLARQSQTLPQAVKEYKSRYGMDPPKGFEKWWEFVVENDVKIVDDVSRGW